MKENYYIEVLQKTFPFLYLITLKNKILFIPLFQNTAIPSFCRVLFFFFTFTFYLYTFSACNTIEPPIPPEPPNDIPIIPPTETRGPGGPAYIAGYISDYVHPSMSVTNTYIYVMNQQDYSDTLAYIFITSPNASFKITDLPEGRVDLIFMNESYLCAKIGKLLLRKANNSFYNPNSNGYFIDSTMFITNIADSVENPNTPTHGLQGYDLGLSVYFKWEAPDSIAWEIVRSSQCDTIRVVRYNDPVFDPFENDIYLIKCSTIQSVSKKLKFFNWTKEVREANPIFQAIQE